MTRVTIVAPAPSLSRRNGTTRSTSIGFISRGTPGIEATNFPSAAKAIKPGAVPLGLSSGMLPVGSSACLRLFSGIGRPIAANMLSIRLSAGS